MVAVRLSGIILLISEGWESQSFYLEDPSMSKMENRTTKSITSSNGRVDLGQEMSLSSIRKTSN